MAQQDNERRQELDIESFFAARSIGLVLPNLDSATKLLISQCEISVSPSKRKIVIACPNKKLALGLCKLRSRRRDLARAANSTRSSLGFAIEWISVYLVDREFLSFRVSGSPRSTSVLTTMLNHQNRDRDSSSLASRDKDLLIEACESPHSVTIVRLNDSVCLFSNGEQTRKFTDLDPTIYLGTSVANLWIPHEQERLFVYLGRDGFVDEFTYKGYRKIDAIKGIYNPVDLCADFRIVDYMGHRCRIGHFRFA